MNEWFPTFRSIGQHATDRAFYNQLWHQFRHTPIRDLVRLQLSGRLNWKARVAESDLPANAKQKITDVVKATRLWRLEKSQIATELIAHMLDGQQQGQGDEAIVANFGETKTVAQLMRSAKKRNRPLAWKTLVAGFYAFVTLAVLYAGLAIWFFSGRPNPSVDYEAIHNQPIMDLPEEQKAWPLYRDLWTKYQLSDGGKHVVEDMFAGEDKHKLARPADAEWSTAVGVLDELSDLLQVFREGANRPSVGLAVHADQTKYSDEDFRALFPEQERAKVNYSWADSFGAIELSDEADQLLGGSTFGALLPHISGFRAATYLFHVDSRRAIIQNDSDRVVQNIATVFGLGKQIAESDFVVCQRLGFVFANNGLLQIEELLIEHPDFLSDQQLLQLQRMVAKLDYSSWLRFNGARLLMQDILQLVYSDDGTGNGRITSVGVEIMQAIARMRSAGETKISGLASTPTVWMPATALRSPSRQTVTRLIDQMFEELEAQAHRPFWEVDFGRVGSELDALGKDHLVAQSMPAFIRTRQALARHMMLRDACGLAIAGERFKRKQGHWPANIEEIPNELLMGTSVDQFTGQSLRFVIEDDVPKIYSVGTDLDDDGGKLIPVLATWSEPEPVKDGDWVVWPQRDSMTQ